MNHIALCSAVTLPAGKVPEWVHVLPAGAVLTKDGRGPYRIDDPRALIALSMSSGKLPIDENHSIDLAAPKGHPAPARGWIVELQQRADGIWGRVEWTGIGHRLMEHREYSGLSPVILHNKAGAVSAILRASLTNTPNLSGLTSLHGQRSSYHAQLTQLKAGIRDLSQRLDLHQKTTGAAAILSSRQATLGKARQLQADLARLGLPIDLASAIGSVQDEEAGGSIHSEVGDGRAQLIERLGLDPMKVDDDIIAAAFIREKSAKPRSVAALLDELSPADRKMIAGLGLNPADYVKNLEADRESGGGNGQ